MNKKNIFPKGWTVDQVQIVLKLNILKIKHKNESRDNQSGWELGVGSLLFEALPFERQLRHTTQSSGSKSSSEIAPDARRKHAHTAWKHGCSRVLEQSPAHGGQSHLACPSDGRMGCPFDDGLYCCSVYHLGFCQAFHCGVDSSQMVSCPYRFLTPTKES